MQPMYSIYREDDFPEGIFRTREGRQAFVVNAFRDVFRERNGVELTDEILKAECRYIENTDESTYERLPYLVMTQHSVPLVMLYFRGGKYEIHVLIPEVSPDEFYVIN